MPHAFSVVECEIFWENKINALSLGMHSLLVSIYIYIYYVVSVLSSGKVQNIRNMQKY